MVGIWEANAESTLPFPVYQLEYISKQYFFSMNFATYLNFRAWAGVSFIMIAESGEEIVDFDACSASDVGKLRPNDDRRGSAEMLVVLLLLLDLCPPPRSTCKWASRRSRLSKERAWLPGITNLRNRRRFCRSSKLKWVFRTKKLQNRATFLCNETPEQGMHYILAFWGDRMIPWTSIHVA